MVVRELVLLALDLVQVLFHPLFMLVVKSFVLCYHKHLLKYFFKFNDPCFPLHKSFILVFCVLLVGNEDVVLALDQDVELVPAVSVVYHSVVRVEHLELQSLSKGFEVIL